MIESWLEFARYQNGEIGRLSRRSGPDSVRLEYEYDHEGRRTKTFDALNHEWTADYDGHGRLLKQTDPAGTWVEPQYQGTLTSLVTTYAKRGADKYVFKQSKTEYDELLRVTKVEQLARNAAFKEGITGGELGGGDGFLTTEYEYDLAGRLTKSTDELGRWTQLAYDDFGRLERKQHQTGNKEEYTYVAQTNLVHILKLTEKTAGADKVTQKEFAYDDLGRTVTYKDEAGNDTLTTYDFAGNILSSTDPEGNSVTHTRNFLGWVLQTDVHAATTTLQSVGYVYDASGLMTMATDAAGKQTTLSYDHRGRLKTRTYVPESSSHTWTYDAAGHVTTLIDPRGTRFTYFYDNRGLLRTLTFTGSNLYGDTGPVKFSYDEIGMLTAAEDGDSRVERGHNTLGQIMAEVQRISVQALPAVYGRTIASHFDDAGQRAKLDYPYSGTAPSANTFILNYAYDTLYRLNALDRQIGPSGVRTTLAQYQYEGYNRLVQANYGNNTRMTVTYDVRNWVTGIQHQADPLGSPKTLFDVERRIDRAGRPTWRNVQHFDPAAQSTPYYQDVMYYQYDAASRLENAYHGIDLSQIQGGWAAVSYNTTPPGGSWGSRDRYGLTSVDTRSGVERWIGANYYNEPYSSDNGHEYVSAVINGVNHTFGKDASGNRTTETRVAVSSRYRSVPPSNYIEYRYDAFNRLVEVVSNFKSITWRHDAFGRVIEEKRTGGEENNGVFRFYHDGDSIVLQVAVANEAVPSSESIAKRYVFGPEGIAPFFARRESDGQQAFFHCDEQGSVMGLTGWGGTVPAVLEHYRYLRDFGEFSAHQGMSGTAVTQMMGNLFGQPYLWKGGRFDLWLHDEIQTPELGPVLLYHMGDRDYDPLTAAYLQRANVGPMAGRGHENPASIMDDPVDGAGGVASPRGWPGSFGNFGNKSAQGPEGVVSRGPGVEKGGGGGGVEMELRLIMALVGAGDIHCLWVTKEKPGYGRGLMMFVDPGYYEIQSVWLPVSVWKALDALNAALAQQPAGLTPQQQIKAAITLIGKIYGKNSEIYKDLMKLHKKGRIDVKNLTTDRDTCERSDELNSERGKATVDDEFGLSKGDSITLCSSLFGKNGSIAEIAGWLVHEWSHIYYSAVTTNGGLRFREFDEYPDKRPADIQIGAFYRSTWGRMSDDARQAFLHSIIYSKQFAFLVRASDYYEGLYNKAANKVSRAEADKQMKGAMGAQANIAGHLERKR